MTHWVPPTSRTVSLTHAPDSVCLKVAAVIMQLAELCPMVPAIGSRLNSISIYRRLMDGWKAMKV